MAPPFPSIQSFLQSSQSNAPKKDEKDASFTSLTPGDGFTQAEVDAVLHPQMDESWLPDRDYDEVDIASLYSGPKCVTFMGRIVNFFDQTTASKMPRAAKGCIKVIVRDDTGALTVRLWYAKIEYKLRLGQLITIWTPHISNGEHGTLAPSSAPLFTSIFPERDRSCYFMTHDNSDTGIQCRMPLRYRCGEPLPGLMTLKNFTDGGYDINGAKVMLYVKSIGAKKKYTTKKGDVNECVHIGVFDDTAEATLTLWGSMAFSAAAWEASKTILLITSPGLRIDRKAWISITSNTMVDVDPDVPDAAWLRGFAQRLARREHVNPPFPKGIFDIETAQTASARILFRLADIDDFSRSCPGEKPMGYLSLVIMELNIMSLHRRRALMCTECCGVPLYANDTRAKCKQCDKMINLRTNPRILGAMIDETGSTSTGKLVFSEQAWQELLGQTQEELVTAPVDVLKYLESRLLFLRITLAFGWAAEEGAGEEGAGAEGAVGRLCIWGVRM